MPEPLDPATRADLLFSIRLALRKVGGATLRDLAKRRLPGDDLCEMIAAKVILDGILQQNWRISRGPPAPAHGSPPRGG